MRFRIKFLIGLAVVLGVIAVLGVIFLGVIPRLPTGYAELEQQRQADLKADGEAVNPAPRPAAGSAMPTSTAAGPAVRPAKPAPAASAARAETPRQAFERCWNFMTGNQRKGLTPAQAGLYQQMDGVFFSSSDDGVSNIISRHLTQEEWEALPPLTTSTTLTRTHALRQLIENRVGGRNVVARLLQGEDVKGVWDAPMPAQGSRQNAFIDENRRAAEKQIALLRLKQGTEESAGKSRHLRERTREFSELTPIQEAADLLRLPDGAIPDLPTLQLPYFRGPKFTPLVQAFLHALAHDPAFDPQRAMRRMNECRRLLKLAAYPRRFDSINDNAIVILIQLICRTGEASGPQLRALVKALEQFEREEALPNDARHERVWRYQSGVTREKLLEDIEPILAGTTAANNNTFSYFLSGKPERWWVTANTLNVRRHIDLFALAIAKGDAEAVERERKSLERTLKLANISLGNTKTLYYYYKPELAMQAPLRGQVLARLRLALLAFWKEKGNLPETLDALVPDYLPSLTMPAWVEWAAGKPALVWVDIRELGLSAHEKEMIRDPARFRQELRKVMSKMPDRVKRPTDAEIEQTRQELLKRKGDGATLNVSAMPLDFAEPENPAVNASTQ